MPQFISVTPTIAFFALLGGILPAVLWLKFWLREDELHPEPRGLIILSFLVGMLATAVAYPSEKFIAERMAGSGDFTLLFLWAGVEEVLKYIGIYIVALRSKYFDEPIDAVIYFVSIALGFAALENTLFLFQPLINGSMVDSILLGNFRFIGASLLHVATSAFLGVCIALTFYATVGLRRLATVFGLFSAIVLHTLFNYFIIISEGEYLYQIFVGLWIFIIGVLYACEKLKKIAPRSHVEYPQTGTVVIPNKFTTL